MNILLKPAIASVVMLFFIKFTSFGLVLTIILSALTYFAILFVLKTLDKQDYTIIKKIFQNEKVQADL